jgi:hypothetical protein
LSQSEAFDIKLFRHQFLETLLCQAATTSASTCSGSCQKYCRVEARVPTVRLLTPVSH